MISNRKTAIIVGVLFIIGTVAGILSAVITGPILTSPTYLVDIAANQSKIVTGALFVLIMGFALAMIPAVLFPIFRKYDEALALGAIIFRGVLEATAYIAIAICWLILITLSRDFVAAGTPAASSFQIIGALLQDAGHWIAQLLAIVFSIGALMIYYLFYKSQLIPRWLSIWGLIGAILYLSTPLFDLFGFKLEMLMIPLALQEMVLAVWLIAKGFTPSEITPVTA